MREIKEVNKEMNKFEKALDYLRWIGSDGYYKKQREKSFDVLQELVDKATPKKIVYREFMKNTPQHEFRESCPNCNCVFDYDALGKKHCSNCGQAIDWSEE